MTALQIPTYSSAYNCLWLVLFGSCKGCPLFVKHVKSVLTGMYTFLCLHDVIDLFPMLYGGHLCPFPKALT